MFNVLHVVATLFIFNRNVVSLVRIYANHRAGCVVIHGVFRRSLGT